MHKQDPNKINFAPELVSKRTDWTKFMPGFVSPYQVAYKVCPICKHKERVLIVKELY